MIKDNEHPFFRPLWRRVVVLAVCLAWAVVEFVSGSTGWGLVALAFGAYAVWQLFIRYAPQEPAKEE